MSVIIQGGIIDKYYCFLKFFATLATYFLLPQGLLLRALHLGGLTDSTSSTYKPDLDLYVNPSSDMTAEYARLFALRG